ncbi:MAG: glycosyltransferase family 4 protein [Armatimonadota bacterium]
MRILMTADTVGGVWTYALELAGALSTRGVEVVLATLGDRPSPSQREAAQRVPGLQLRKGAFRLEWMDDPWDDVDRSSEWLLELEAEVRPDVVHLCSFSHGSLPWTAPSLLVAHSCVLSWWEAVRGEAAPAEWETYRRRVAAGLRGADLVAAPTRAMLDAITRLYGSFPEGVVLPNGRAPEAFSPRQKEPFVLSAGRLWDDAKNLSALAAVAPKVGWPVHVAGSLEHPSGRTEPAAGVECLGRLEPPVLAEQLARAAIYAHPARYEPFGLAVLEAAYSGCALVLGDIPSLREVWGDAATFVRPDDSEALLAALVRLIERPEERARMALRARARAFDYTAEAMADRYVETYRRLSGRQGRGSRSAAQARKSGEPREVISCGS